MNYRNYIFIPSEYGLVHVCPLYVANITATKLEQLFENSKFMFYAISNTNKENYNTFHLPIEFKYSLRTEEIRNFETTKSDVKAFLNAKIYQQMNNCVIDSLTMLYECKLILEEKRQGDSILSFKEYISKKMEKFDKKNFPDKMDFFASLSKSKEILDIINNMNRVRNCIEHRNGIVSKVDCKDNDFIEINFRYPKLEDNKGEIRVDGRYDSGNGSTLSLQIENLRYHLGDKIELDMHDCYKSIYSIFAALKQIVDGIYDSVHIAPNKQNLIIREFKIENDSSA